jgi:peptidoglycan/xylan/chitin deacetylase (PgdA/CDA1 family)
VNRRSFVSACGTVLGAIALDGAAVARESAPQIAITMDDPKPDTLGGVSGAEINRRILAQLHDARLKAALFVTGMRIDSPEGAALLREWDAAGHQLGNHSYSHRNFNSSSVTYDAFAADFLRNEPLVREYRHFAKLFRYPLLKEGDTADKRDRFRALLREHGYGVGHVTVDASDWYVDARLRARLEKEPGADRTPYRDYYVRHIRDRARYYRQLARDVLGHEIRHTLLIHHNLLNALYLADVMAALRGDGWKLVDAADAFRDPVYTLAPATLPAGESLAWALAKQAGRFNDRLRYPGEDSVYEEPGMNALGL